MGYTSVMISSGHGSKIEGAVGNGYREHVEATKVMTRVAQILKYTHKINVVTFEDIYSKNQNDNLKKIVQKHNSTNRQLDISIHFNSSANKTATGTEVLYHSGAGMQQLSTKMSKAIADALGIRDRGAKQNTGLYFLNKTAKPAILIEVAFISNANDMKAYKDNFEELCQAIACVIAGKTYTKKKVEVVKEVVEEVKTAKEPDQLYRLYTGTWKTKATAETKATQLKTLISVCYVRDEGGVYRLVTGTFKSKESAEKFKKIAKEKFNITLHIQEA